MKIFATDRERADRLFSGASLHRVNQEEKQGFLPAAGPREEEEEEDPCLPQLPVPPQQLPPCSSLLNHSSTSYTEVD